MIELPRYVCHKEVGALKIKAIARGVITLLTFEEPGYPALSVSYDYDVKHNPKPGGYFVVYDDGYQSFSPAEPFEAGYTRRVMLTDADAAADLAGAPRPGNPTREKQA